MNTNGLKICCEHDLREVVMVGQYSREVTPDVARIVRSHAELLAACKALVRAGWHDPDCAEEFGGKCNCGMKARFDTAAAAIAKAEGGAS